MKIGGCRLLAYESRRKEYGKTIPKNPGLQAHKRVHESRLVATTILSFEQQVTVPIWTAILFLGYNGLPRIQRKWLIVPLSRTDQSAKLQRLYEKSVYKPTIVERGFGGTYHGNKEQIARDERHQERGSAEGAVGRVSTAIAAMAALGCVCVHWCCRQSLGWRRRRRRRRVRVRVDGQGRCRCGKHGKCGVGGVVWDEGCWMPELGAKAWVGRLVWLGGRGRVRSEG